MPDRGNRELIQAVEAADRAGALVTEQVRSVIRAAETRAAELRQSANQDAISLRREAVGAANRVLERVDAADVPLSELVVSLRREAERLSGDLD